MRVKFWGTRGSIPAPGPETVRYGGNTSCVEVRGPDDTLLVLDAGTGIRRMNQVVPRDIKRVDILLTHLHLDHVVGLGFFAPLRWPDLEVHVWGPASTTHSLAKRLTRYLSPPLFPVHLRDLPVNLHLHEVRGGSTRIGELEIKSAYVIHPGPTVGYRINGPGGSIAYIPDHEPAMGNKVFPATPEWTSGYKLAEGADVLIHDGQYNTHEYPTRVGWGHSTMDHAMEFAKMVGVGRFVPFHHDPGRDDDAMDKEWGLAATRHKPGFDVTPAAEGQEIILK
jgi:phosphoribosyl 1,2-cyclic phosphodiesterase